MEPRGVLVILQPGGGVERRVWTDPGPSVKMPNWEIIDYLLGRGNLARTAIYEGHRRWIYLYDNWRSTKLPINLDASNLLNHPLNRRASQSADVAVHGPLIISFPPGDHPQFDLGESKTEILCPPML